MKTCTCITSVAAFLLVACGSDTAPRKVVPATPVANEVNPINLTPAPISPAAATPEAPSIGKWTVDEETDKMDKVRNVTLMLRSDEPMELAFPYNDKYASLVIRCKKQSTDFYIVTETPVHSVYGEFSSTRIRYRFDEEKPVSSTFSESTDHSAVFAPSPISLARRLAKATSWTFEFTPYDAGPTSVTFSVSGLAQALPKVSSACGWKA